ncbi:MAG: septal ring lytic transglycosylase RlpA family protein [Gammaproteobacteria bacterium]|nr:septal ring lytic transglycosylase RlpA family protein [Gammaproteobacteria bacterium]
MGESLLPLLILLVLIQACGGPQKREAADGPSTRSLSASDVKDAVPRQEPRARYGNRSPYEVLGKRYTVMNSSAGYKARGIASWYGSKFHGRRTSSGEPFDMHLATAAHRSLPLPTYAEVTNLDNGRKVIVKINDRGPFHEDRLIDLSYGAAVKLDMASKGTARVEVRAISFDEPQPAPLQAGVTGGTFLQVGAFSRRDSAEQLAGLMMQEHLQPVSIEQGSGLFRVWIGPYPDESDIELASRRVVELGLERPHKVRR